MREDIVTVSVVNFKPAWGNKECNLNRMKGYVKAAARQGSEIVIFPEMALTGYDNEVGVPKEEKMQTKLAETIPGPATEELGSLAKELDIYVIFGMPEADKAGSVIYNSAAICCPDGTIQKYRKIHLPLDESDWATRGEEEMVFDTKWGKIGLSICYDTYDFPELIRYARGKGARLFINCTACCKAAAPAPMVQTLLEGNVIRDTVFIASANLCGYDKYNYFLGGSSIIGPSNDMGGVYYIAGKSFYEEKADEENIYTATIDLTLTQQNTSLCMYGHNSRTGTTDLRPELYSRIYKELAEDEEWKKFTYED